MPEEQLKNRTGYDPSFILGHTVELPTANDEIRDDLATVDGSHVLRYMHFSLAMSRSRRLCRWVAWNIDKATLLDEAGEDSPERTGFRADDRLSPARETQVTGDFYEHNPLDQGHIARRADLVWGTTRQEAEDGNYDSAYYTNIVPQMEGFNQHKKVNDWGGLETDLAEALEDGERISVFAGPVLNTEGLAFQNVQVPRSFWKLLVYLKDGRLQARGFLLNQDLDPIRRRLKELDHQHTEETVLALEDLTGLSFDVGPRARQVREPAWRPIETLQDVEW